MGKLIVRIASLLLIAAFLPTAVLAAEWNLENGSIEITATANAEGGTTQTVSQGGSSAEDSNPTSMVADLIMIVGRWNSSLRREAAMPITP